jgi:DDE family transposase
MAWQVETAKDNGIPLVPTLLDIVEDRSFAPSVVVLDRGYDAKDVYAEIEGRHMRPVIPLKDTPAVKAGKHKPPECEHGEWTFAGSDAPASLPSRRYPGPLIQPGFANRFVKPS